jgi:anti-sigma regulatory factor (Ser/Thr protein kinase)
MEVTSGLGFEPEATTLAVSDPTHVGEARRAVADLSRRLGLEEPLAGRLAIIVTEAAGNVVRHARSGEMVVRPIGGRSGPGIEVLALDRGPGILDVARSLQDGYSTSDTPGTGLGAIRRLSNQFDLYSLPGRGTALLSRVFANGGPAPASPFQVGAICLPKPGETVAGDACQMTPRPRGARVVVVDGLGHGPDAHRAARVALVAAAGEPGEPAAVVDACHHALRSTRGAALAVADVDREQGRVRFAGVGNVTGAVLAGARRQNLVSINGTAGQGSLRLREFDYTWPAEGLLVMATDGLGTRWALQDYPGLAARDPSLVAAVLYRDHTRGRDDVTVAAVREHSGRGGPSA